MDLRRMLYTEYAKMVIKVSVMLAVKIPKLLHQSLSESFARNMELILLLFIS